MTENREPTLDPTYTALEEAAGVTYDDQKYPIAQLPNPFTAIHDIPLLESYPDPGLVQQLAQREADVLKERKEIFDHTLNEEQRSAVGLLNLHLTALAAEYGHVEKEERESRNLIQERTSLWEDFENIRPSSPSQIRSQSKQEEWVEFNRRDEEINSELRKLNERVSDRYGVADADQDEGHVDIHSQIKRAKTILLRNLYMDLHYGDSIINSSLNLSHYLRQIEDDVEKWEIADIDKEQAITALRRSVLQLLGAELKYIPPEDEIELPRVAIRGDEQISKSDMWEWFIGKRPEKQADTIAYRRFYQTTEQFERLAADIRTLLKIDDGEHISDTEILELIPHLSALQIAHFGKYGSLDTTQKGMIENPSPRKTARLLAAVDRFRKLQERKVQEADTPLEIIDPLRFLDEARLMTSKSFDFKSHYEAIITTEGDHVPISKNFDEVIAMLREYNDRSIKAGIAGASTDLPVSLPFKAGSDVYDIASALLEASEDSPVHREDILRTIFDGDESRRSSLNTHLSKIRNRDGVILHQDEDRGLWLEIEGEKRTIAQQLNQNISTLQSAIEETVKNEPNTVLSEEKLKELTERFIHTDGIAPSVRKALVNMFFAARELREGLRSKKGGIAEKGATFFQRHIDVLAGLMNENGTTDSFDDNELVAFQHALNDALRPFLSEAMGGSDRSRNILSLNAALNTLVWVRKKHPDAIIQSVKPHVDYKNKIDFKFILGSKDEYHRISYYVSFKGVNAADIEEYEVNDSQDIDSNIRSSSWREGFAEAFDYVKNTNNENSQFIIVLAPNSLPNIDE